MERKSEILKFNKTDPDYSREMSDKKVKQFIKDKNIYNIRDFEDDKVLYVAIIWDE